MQNAKPRQRNEHIPTNLGKYEVILLKGCKSPEEIHNSIKHITVLDNLTREGPEVMLELQIETGPEHP